MHFPTRFLHCHFRFKSSTSETFLTVFKPFSLETVSRSDKVSKYVIESTHFFFLIDLKLSAIPDWKLYGIKFDRRSATRQLVWACSNGLTAERNFILHNFQLGSYLRTFYRNSSYLFWMSTRING